MRHRRHLVAVILVYVAIDLCLASMPGAFVFAADDSVESTVMSRPRHIPGPAPATLPAAAHRHEPLTGRHDAPHEPAWTLRRPRLVPAASETKVTPSGDREASTEDPH